METAVLIVGLTIFVLLGFVLVGGPVFVADWQRARRRAVVERQITLTDALDSAFGPIVAPVVTKPLARPWEVQIASPPLGTDRLARLIGVVDKVFSDAAGQPTRDYRIILTLTPDAPLARNRGSRGPAKRWSESPAPAA